MKSGKIAFSLRFYINSQGLRPLDFKVIQLVAKQVSLLQHLLIITSCTYKFAMLETAYNGQIRIYLDSPDSFSS